MSNRKSRMVQGHQARKRFGQNFLSDNYYIRRIVDAIAPSTNDQMVEIGPGLGAITELLVEQVQSLDVVELDKDLIPRLEEKFAAHENFSIHHSDALKFNFSKLADDQSQASLRIVGNLPYNISTPLIFHLLSHKNHIRDMYFMLQKEVVERICAEPNTKAYGRLSVMCQYYCDTQMLFTVPPGAFMPPPKVDSAIVRLAPKASDQLTAQNPNLLAKLVTDAFSQRRKTVRNTLKKWANEQQLTLAGIDPSARAETLSLAQFIDLANNIEATTPSN